MDNTDKLILAVDDRAKAVNDQMVAKMIAGEITDIDFIQALTAESPFYIRNGVLTTVDAPAITDEIKRMQEHMMNNPPGLRVDGQTLLAREAEALASMPELAPNFAGVKAALNDAKCVGCAKNKELAKLHVAMMALHRADHAAGKIRAMAALAPVFGQAFVDAWAKPPPPADAPVSLPRMSWAPTRNYQQVADKLQKLQTPVSLAPPGVKAAPPAPRPFPRFPQVLQPQPPVGISQDIMAKVVDDTTRPSFMSGDKKITIPQPPPDAAINQVALPDLPDGRRKHCFDCYGKHLMQAQVLVNEVQKGYPEHCWLAVGHLAEAEDEILAADPQLADMARSARLGVMRDPLGKPDLMPLMRLCLERRETPQQ